MQVGHGSQKLRVANRVSKQVLWLFAKLCRRNAGPSCSEARISWRGDTSNSHVVGGFDSDPDFAPAHFDNGDLDARSYENAFANLAAQYKHLTPP
jgi:hypothetical protein